MKKIRPLVLCSLSLLALCCATLRSGEANAAVTLTEDADLYTLDNGIVTARIAKASGDLVSLRYKNLEMLATFLKADGTPDLERDPPGANPNGLNPRMTDHQYGFWSHDAMGPRGTAPAIARVTIDPRANDGERAEVSVKGIADGRKMGTGPGASPDGQFAADVEIRYALERGSPGVYTYSTFTHRDTQPATAIAEARFCAKLAGFFDWMSVDARRDFHYPRELKVGDKYIYTALQSANPAFGWSSQSEKVGLFFINPSMEYMSGSPTKVEFLGHRDTNAVAAPCLLNYWRSSHYGGAQIVLAEGELWQKTVGPFFIYANSGENPQAIYADARARAAAESAKWPYAWANGSDVDYPPAAERATVAGRLALNDNHANGNKFARLAVGLTKPGADWQRDAKYYQFWTTGNGDGHFEIKNVRPGHYTLRAFADGVLGEFVQTGVFVEPGKPLDLGTLTWTPVRRGRALWEIGIPNRNASEFFMAGQHDDPEISLRYAALFPDDIRYTIGKSDWSRDWFFQHVPHNEDPSAKSSPFYGARSPGRAAPRTIAFTLDSAPAANARATLRLALCGTGAKSIEISVNDRAVGVISDLVGDGVITRHGTQGIWYEREFSFDAALLRAGENTLTLTIPAGPVNNGVMYDYLRLELDEPAAKPTLFIAGDSTVADGRPNAVGWGKHAGEFFDTEKVNVVNRALGGRSSRTFITEGHWDNLLAELHPGDVVLIQFGHNDRTDIGGSQARGTLPGLGDETKDIQNLAAHGPETVRTFGWYVRKMVADVKARGAQPILLSLTVRNTWKDNRVERDIDRYGEWCREISAAEKIGFVDATKIIADYYETIGRDAVKPLFSGNTHTTDSGAKLNAHLITTGLRDLHDQRIKEWFSPAAHALPVR